MSCIFTKKTPALLLLLLLCVCLPSASCNSLFLGLRAITRWVTEGTPNLDWRGFIYLLAWGKLLIKGVLAQTRVFDRGFYLSIVTITAHTGPPI